MPAYTFEPNKTVETDTPIIEVAGELSIGSHIFQLIVEDNTGNRSEPVITTVKIVREAPVIDRRRLLQLLRENPSISPENIERICEIIRTDQETLKQELEKMAEEGLIRIDPRRGCIVIL